MIPCLLCHNETTSWYASVKNIVYHKCDICTSVFKHPKYYLSPEAEKKRYLEHNNDIEDIRYQRFVAPITNSIIQNFTSGSKGLDFGAGTGPVIKKLLEEKGYQIELYDPFFHKDNKVLSVKYDFIACCEVMEHFHNPNKEFKLLKKMLAPQGMLFCMTELIPDNKPFIDWYYINDPTHIFFYTKDSLLWIKEQYSFSKITINGRLIIFNT